MAAGKSTATELFIPKMGQTVEEVTLMDWLVEDGAKVEAGTPVLEVETDKAVFPVEATASGYLHIGPYQAGQVVPVLTVVATVGKKDEGYPAAGQPLPGQTSASVEGPAAAIEAGEAGQAESAPVTGVPAASAPVTGAQVTGERRFISPRARRLAREKHLDLARLSVGASGEGGRRTIEKDVIAYLGQIPKATPVAASMAAQAGLDLAGMVGTGVKGAVTKADIERALGEKPSLEIAPAPGAAAPAPAAAGALPEQDEVIKTIPLSGVRAIIFDRMGTSVHTTARVTLVTETDATRLVKTRETLKETASEAWGFTPGYNDLLGLIVARSLREFPYMNARLSEDGRAIEWLAQVNLGMAVDTERGLLVPVVREADRKGLREFGAELRQLVERARAGRSLPDDLSGGTFTITNLGMYDVDAFTPVIHLPEAAILGVGRIQAKAVPHKGKVRVRQMLTLSLVFDHRLNDGAPAARFLQRIKQYIENPFLLLG